MTGLQHTWRKVLQVAKPLSLTASYDTSTPGRFDKRLWRRTWREYSSYFPLAVLSVYYAVVVTLPDCDALQGDAASWNAFYVLMVICAFVVAMLDKLPETRPSRTHELAMVFRTVMVTVNFISWSYIRKKPFQCFDEFAPALANVFFWITQVFVLFISVLTVLVESPRGADRSASQTNMASQADDEPVSPPADVEGEPSYLARSGSSEIELKPTPTGAGGRGTDEAGVEIDLR